MEDKDQIDCKGQHFILQDGSQAIKASILSRDYCKKETTTSSPASAEAKKPEDHGDRRLVVRVVSPGGVPITEWSGAVDPVILQDGPILLWPLGLGATGGEAATVQLWWTYHD